MGHRTRTGLGIICLLVFSLACSKKKEGEEAVNKETPPATTAGTAAGPLTTGNAPFAPVIIARGYRVVQAKRFPAQVDARRATVVVYCSADNARGGILYVRGFQDDPPRPTWHWYFGNAAPDSVMAVDINRDGLWDVRAFMAGGATQEFIQEKDFTFRGSERGGLAAMNGAASSTEGMYRAFDADTSTAWQAPSAGAYLEVPNPFGMEAGQLKVRLAGGSRPHRLEIGDGTRKLQECDLDATFEEQRFQLDAAIKDLPTIRITVVGQGRTVAISELELQ